MTDTPVGSEYATWLVTSRVAPETGTGAVSAATRSWSWAWSPSTETTSGLTSTDPIRNPAAGVPVTMGLTGNVRFSRLVYTGIFTWTLEGSRLTPVTTSPAASTASGVTSRSTLTPLPSIVAVTRALTTRLTAADGPVTTTSGGVTVASPTCRFGGGSDCVTMTLTVLLTFVSRMTWMVRGLKSRMVTRGSTAVTLTRRLTGFPSGLTFARSTVARKSSARRRPRSAGAMYWICSTSFHWFVITVPAGWLTGSTVMGPGYVLLSCEATSPA